MEEQNLFQKFFRSELTWLGMIVLTLWGFVSQVILPLQKIQLELDNVQSAVNQVQSYDARITQNSNDIIQLKDEIGVLRK